MPSESRFFPLDKSIKQSVRVILEQDGGPSDSILTSFLIEVGCIASEGEHRYIHDMQSEFQRFLEEEFQKRKSINTSYSLRAFARDLKVSPSTLSKFFRTGNIHPETIKRILDRFPGVTTQRREGLVSSITALSMFEDEIERYFADTEIFMQRRYRKSDSLSIKVVSRFRSLTTGKMIPHFVDDYISVENQVSCRVYFIQNPNGTFRTLMSENFANQLPHDWHMKKNEELKVTFVDEFYPQIQNIVITVLNERKYVLGDLLFCPSEILIRGQIYKYDSDEPPNPYELCMKSFD